jgi:hypothetical protein
MVVEVAGTIATDRKEFFFRKLLLLYFDLVVGFDALRG